MKASGGFKPQRSISGLGFRVSGIGFRDLSYHMENEKEKSIENEKDQLFKENLLHQPTWRVRGTS